MCYLFRTTGASLTLLCVWLHAVCHCRHAYGRRVAAGSYRKKERKTLRKRVVVSAPTFRGSHWSPLASWTQRRRFELAVSLPKQTASFIYSTEISLDGFLSLSLPRAELLRTARLLHHTPVVDTEKKKKEKKTEGGRTGGNVFTLFSRGCCIPFLEVRKLSSRGTYWMS